MAATPTPVNTRPPDAAPARHRGRDTDEQWRDELEKMKTMMQEETSHLRAVLASMAQAMDVSKRASAEMRQDLQVVKRQAL